MGTGRVPSGSLILSTRAPIGHLAIAGTALCTNQGCRSLIFRSNCNQTFFFDHLLSMKQELKSWGQGSTFSELGKARLEATRILVPPLKDNNPIATFLDQETARINTLIAKKERLIRFLQEKRTALISHAVTKGLNPTVPMKNSGVEWLGRFRTLGGFASKKTCQNSLWTWATSCTIRRWNAIYSCYQCEKWCDCDEGMLYIDASDIPQGKDAVLSADEIIVVRSGAYTGDSAIIPMKYQGTIAGYDMVVTVMIGFSSFVAWQLLSSEVRDLQFYFYSQRAAQPHLSTEELGDTLFSVPPLPEQQTIATYLDYETAKIDALISRVGGY